MTGPRHLAAPFALAAVLAIALAACSNILPEQAPPPSPQAQTNPKATPRPAPPPAPAPSPAAPSGDWTAAPIEPGLWVYRRDARGSIALFGPANAGARLTLRCDLAARKLYLSRASAAPAARTMTVRATIGLSALPARPTGADGQYIAAELAPDAAILDQMSFSRGRFAVESAPDTRLVVPAHPEFARVVEDCRA